MGYGGVGIARRLGRANFHRVALNKFIGGGFRSQRIQYTSTTIINPQFKIRNSPRIASVQHAQQMSSDLKIFRGFSSTETETEKADGVVTQRLNKLIAGGSIQTDPHQLRASRELDRLYRDLVAMEPFQEQEESGASSQAESGGFFSGLFGDFSSNDDERETSNNGPSATGIYTYGGVGCGKTFLMELFYNALDNEPNWSKDKQMIHYHKFMLNVHQFMHNSKQEQREAGANESNPIDVVVDHVLKSGRLLCLDEFQVTDVADAMILKELFGKLWKRGCILVTTSNRPPRDLYLNGLQRDRFLPFIDLLEDKCTVVSLMENETDYRMVISARDNPINDEEENDEHSKAVSDGVESPTSKPVTSARRARQVYFCGKDQKKVLQKLFYERARGRPTNPSTLETQGRNVNIPMACKSKSICMFSFEDLCQKALGAADYLVIGQNFSTVFVHGVPEMTVNEINWLRRFITFVDSMYEWKVRVLLHTNVDSVEKIFVVDDKESYQQDEVFAFDRTYSRLGEMSSTQYLSSQWLGGDTTVGTTKLNLDPSLADQWSQLVDGSLEESTESSSSSSSGDDSNDETRFEELFDRLDANSDGVLDKDEIKAMMSDAFGYEPVDLVVNEMIASVDTDQNGVIDLDEFKALLAEIRNHTKG